MRQSRDIGLRLLSARTGMIIPQGLRLISDRHLTDEKIGGKVVADEAYHAGETEFDEILQKIRKTNPTHLPPCSTAMAEVLLPQVAKAALRIPFLRQIPGKTFPW